MKFLTTLVSWLTIVMRKQFTCGDFSSELWVLSQEFIWCENLSMLNYLCLFPSFFFFFVFGFFLGQNRENSRHLLWHMWVHYLYFHVCVCISVWACELTSIYTSVSVNACGVCVCACVCVWLCEHVSLPLYTQVSLWAQAFLNVTPGPHLIGKPCAGHDEKPGGLFAISYLFMVRK